VIEGVFDRVGTEGKVTLAVSSGKLTVGTEKDVVAAGKLKETELPGNDTSEIELIAKEDSVGTLPLGSDVELSDRPGTDSESSDDKIGELNEVPLKTILEKLVVNTLAKSLVGTPPGVVRPGDVRPGVVRPGDVRPGDVRPGVDKLTETEGTEKLPVKTLDENEGKSGDRLVDSPFEGREMLPVDKVGSTDPTLDVPSDESPGRLDTPEVGTATEVGSDMRSDALKVPVVKIVTVYGAT
jgi:hypothetical protein